MPKHGKRYRSNLEKVDREHQYSPAEAVAILKDFQPTKYDETVEVHIRTGLNVRHADHRHHVRRRDRAPADRQAEL